MSPATATRPHPTAPGAPAVITPTAPPTFELARYSYAAALALARGLDLPLPIAIALARRGFTDPAAARAFIAAAESHDPSLIEGIDAAAAAIRGALKRGERITVHGDYDVDGVTATAIVIGALRELGGECDWLIPDRLGEGYGLREASVHALAERGTKLIVTVDCGITSVAEVALARELGLGVVISDHHQPEGTLPECPIVHPGLGGYPCAELCGAAVAHKLVAALVGVERAERDLDLVALATVADAVPLVGENRSLVRRGIAAARRRPRPGLAALMATASIVPERLRESDLSFRLAPRINAAGRMYRADAGVELLLSADPERAAQIARELDRANLERREVESAVLAEAEAQARALPPELAAAPALVLWGEGWHPGVVGICASRIAERHGKPALLIAIDGEGAGRGSGRSVAGFDLLAALRACERHLARFGGHVAAAGFELAPGAAEALREAFVGHASELLASGAPPAPQPIDAVLAGEDLGHELAEQIERLGPFGRGNPEPRLLVAAGAVSDVRPMGEGERHARFSLGGASGRAAGVAFGVNGSLAAAAQEGRLDLAVRLELNHFNGAVEPRVVLERAYPVPSRERAAPPAAAGEELLARVHEAMAKDPAGTEVRERGGSELGDLALPAREAIPGSAGSALATLTELASCGEPTIVLCADGGRRAGVIDRALDPDRFGGTVALLAGRRSLLGAEAAIGEVLLAGAGAVLADWPTAAALPGLAEPFTHVLVLDPAPDAALERAALARARGGGYAHRLFGAAEIGFAARVYEHDLPAKAALGRLYRELREAPGPGERRLAEAAALPGASPELLGRCLRVLGELGLVRAESGPGRGFSVVSSERRELDASPSFRAYTRAREETVRYLSELKQSA